MIGMYVHQHWPYHHPYSARTWTLDDWRGYAGGLKQLGYNTLLIWPMLEIMPDPLTPSDRASLEKIGRVIDMLHHELEMRAYIVLCPNVGVDSAEAAKTPFEKRHFFSVDTRVNPGDPAALDRLVRWREQLMRPLKNVDGVAIIDSDPGGYPGSTNEEFVHLLAEHRKMLDRVRPGIELIYWMHAGWEAYGRYYTTGKLVLGSDDEHEDALARLKALNPEPWGVANGLPYAEELGVANRVVRFNYGRIEGEPSFPMTNFGGIPAYEAGKAAGPRGVMANAQTHCVQLPNTFAFARGATGKSLTEEDYQHFADQLIRHRGAAIVRAWEALASDDAHAMRVEASEMENLASAQVETGKLVGLLFGDPYRFLTDLAMMLHVRAAIEELHAATQAGTSAKEPLRQVIRAAEAWQHRTGYENMWYDPRLREALARLHSAPIDRVLAITWDVKGTFDAQHPAFDAVQANLRQIETYTPQLLAAMKQALAEMK